MPCSLSRRVGGVFGCHAVRTIAHTLIELLLLILVVRPVHGWNLFLCLFGPRVRTLAASMCAAFRLALGGSVFVVAGFVRRLSPTLSSLSGVVWGSARL